MDPGESQVLAACEGGCNSRFGLAIPKQVRAEKLSLLFSGNKERLLALQTDNAVPEDKTRALRKAGGGGRAWALPQATLLIVTQAPTPGNNNEKILATLTWRKLLSSVGKRSSVLRTKSHLP